MAQVPQRLGDEGPGGQGDVPLRAQPAGQNQYLHIETPHSQHMGIPITLYTLVKYFITFPCALQWGQEKFCLPSGAKIPRSSDRATLNEEQPGIPRIQWQKNLRRSFAARRRRKKIQSVFGAAWPTPKNTSSHKMNRLFRRNPGSSYARSYSKKGGTPFLRFASRPVSRVLSFKTAIYLDATLPARSSRLPGTVGPTSCPSTALLRIEFTAMGCSQPSGELLPHLSTFSGQKAGSLFLLHFS